jgi:hypothetical protein
MALAKPDSERSSAPKMNSGLSQDCYLKDYQRGYGFAGSLFSDGYLPRHHIALLSSVRYAFALPDAVYSSPH